MLARVLGPRGDDLARATSADRSVLAIAIGVKILVLAYGATAFQMLADERIQDPHGLLEIWDRWDSPHYLDLARDGYAVSGDAANFIVFFPLFPLATRMVSLLVGGDYLLGAFIVSTVASVAAALLLFRLVRLDFSAEVALGAVWFLFIFPTSFVLHIAYTEGLFLALTLGSFLAARTGRWPVAGVLGALASLTRINGVLIAPALAVEVIIQWRRDRRWRWDYLWLAAVPLGFAAYLTLNYQTIGDPLRFVAVQHDHWFQQLTWPWETLGGALRAISWRTPTEAMTLGVQQVVFAGIGLAGTVLAWLRLRPSYGVWMTANWLTSVSTGFAQSVPRFTLLLFPLFILFAQKGLSGPRSAVIATWSLLFLALFVSEFVRGRWAF